LQLVLQWAELRDERLAEILTQIDNQTPFWGSLLPIQASRLQRTCELLDIVNEFAVFVEMRFKHELACWRPTDLSWMVQPMITTPGHGATPSGHATQSYAVLQVLKALLNTMRVDEDGAGQPKTGKPFASVNQQMGRVAARIATNRVVAGLHFPVDNIAGRLLGTVLGEYFVYRCGGTGSDGEPFVWKSGGFLGKEFAGSEDFDPDAQHYQGTDKRPYYDYKSPFTGEERPPKAPNSLLMNLWAKAVDELNALSLRFS
jgi:membrane-associated phospholipid phosphatase